MKLQYLLNFALLAVSLFSSLHAADKPNILIFFVDDMGWADTELNGSRYYESPAQKRLASEGMFFSQAYATPLCSPSRAALLSGQYPGLRFNMSRAITGGSVDQPSIKNTANPKNKTIWPTSINHLPLDTHTIAESLQEAGYQTWHLGKWHLNKGKAAANGKGSPREHGFEKWIGIGGAGPGGFFGPFNRIPEYPEGEEGEYLGDHMANQACKLLEERDTEKPFFMYYACFNVHAPYEAKPDLQSYYAEKLKSMPADNKQNNPVMAAMLHSMDDELKIILDKLDELKLSDDTLIIFTSDNGGVNFSKGLKGSDKRLTVTSNEPLRGGKCSWYEGGVRVPMIIKWPGLVPSNVRSEVPVHLIDLYPTILSAINQTPKPDQVLDGVDLAPLFKTGKLANRPLFCHFPRSITTADTNGGSFVRAGDYKLIREYGGNEDGSDRYYLYNLREDIGETTDLSGKLPEMAATLKKYLNNWLNNEGTLIPKPNPNYKPKGS